MNIPKVLSQRDKKGKIFKWEAQCCYGDIIITGKTIRKFKMACEFCDLIKADRPEDKVYFETEEIIILEKNENLVVGLIKEHKANVEDNTSSGLIKIMMRSISKNKFNSNYTFKKADDCKDHFGIYVTIRTK